MASTSTKDDKCIDNGPHTFIFRGTSRDKNVFYCQKCLKVVETDQAPKVTFGT